MIYLDSMKNIKNYEGKVSKVWCIVRSLKFPPRLNHAEIVQVSDLSPSYDLFKKNTWILETKNCGINQASIQFTSHSF